MLVADLNDHAGVLGKEYLHHVAAILIYHFSIIIQGRSAAKVVQVDVQTAARVGKTHF